VPDLRSLLERRFRRRRAAVADGWAAEQHQRSPLRSTDVEPPPWSPDRTAWAAAEIPCEIACSRRIRRAQAGGPPGLLVEVGAAPDESPRRGGRNRACHAANGCRTGA